jgi:hypothetical protein
MTTEKITKNDYYNTLIAILKGDTTQFDLHKDDLIAFCMREKELLAKKAESAKASAAKRKAAPDELCEELLRVLNDEYANIHEVVGRCAHPDMTVGKAQYRLNKMAEQGLVRKGDTLIYNTETRKPSKRVGYAKA